MGVKQQRPALLLGNGPSLREWDLAQQSLCFDTFGMNAAYRFWKLIDWYPDYYACLDLVVGESHLEAISEMVERSAELGIKRFLLRENIVDKLSADMRDVVVCYDELVRTEVLPFLPDTTTGSHTMLWAQSLGYQTILLAGVDLDYVEKVEHADLKDGVLHITKKGSNPNYFFDDYQQPGDVYNIPNPRPNLHMESWENAHRALELETVVLNMNPDSKLDTFGKAQRREHFSCSVVEPSDWCVQEIDTKLERMNKLRFVPNELADLADSVKNIRARDEWCASVLIDGGDPARRKQIAWWITYDAQSGRLAAQRVTAPSGLVIVGTLDLGYLRRVLVAIEAIGEAGIATNAAGWVYRGVVSAVRALLPARLRRVSVRENVADFVSFYTGPRGAAILILQTCLAILIASSDFDWLRFLLIECTLLTLFPLVSRR